MARSECSAGCGTPHPGGRRQENERRRTLRVRRRIICMGN
ncbi:hypothetical protein BRYFOR_08335 [Marvinbryantia formatexigens DSM 14469]|uniref:Uncharacterized protein n=1 Tax=Marvinbryantia formatexigens DSM 14469 TaxID=478749 RepID=C6LI64_9FIRM|nr:hypothetical protein BRYFOR_08335 [Marvinbryantia formatexigens DSM 14469]